jgi:hypothetical protein
VIARIEAMIEKIVDGLLEEHEVITITLKSRAALSRRRVTAAEGDARTLEPKERDINFPGASAQEAWNFSQCTLESSGYILTFVQLYCYGYWSSSMVASSTTPS